MNVGEAAPDFELPDHTGATWRLSDHRGKVVVLLFYPRDNTPVCTTQMCAVRDRWADYRATGAEVAGISRGSVEAHAKFATRHHLLHPLLADEHGRVAKLFRARSLLGGTRRAVIVIDAEGIVRHRKTLLPIFRPGDEEVLAAIRAASVNR